MTLLHILVFVLFALLVRWLCPRKWRGWLLLSGSLLAVFWLQPSSPIRNMDYWLPVGTITLTMFVWAIVHPTELPFKKTLYSGLIVICGVFLIVGASRLIPGLCCITPTRPPGLSQIMIALTGILILFFLFLRFAAARNWIPGLAIALLIGIFIVLKSETLSRQASAGLRSLQGQSTDLASSTDLAWLGFSYLAFRLIHVLRDFQTKKIPPVSLEEFSNYALFYPTITAGPIDRMQRFMPDYRNGLIVDQTPAPVDHSETQTIIHAKSVQLSPPLIDALRGGERILIGIFKKFVLADALAMMSLNSQNALQSTSAAWTWVLLYAFAFRLYFDFSGYTDIALGLGRIMGIKLPENFDQPYLKPNLTAFWNSWHITLAQWFRAYYFNPATRSLRSKYRRLPAWSVILFGQISTMVLIGLWHGITWSFFAWGTWHGVGLFIHNRWSEWRKSRQEASSPALRWNLYHLLGVFVTFNFVSLGWVFFISPNLDSAFQMFRRLFGL